MTPNEIIGKPWLPCGRDPATGLDCWGVVRALRPDAPDYAASPDDQRALLRAFADGVRHHGWKLLNAPVDGCVVRLGRRMAGTHVGIWWRGRIIHATRERGVVSDRPADLPTFGFPCATYWDWRA